MRERAHGESKLQGKKAVKLVLTVVGTLLFFRWLRASPVVTATRVVVVLGYSHGGGDELHPVCAARLERAAEVATADDVVVLSGWARTYRTASPRPS